MNPIDSGWGGKDIFLNFGGGKKITRKKARREEKVGLASVAGRAYWLLRMDVSIALPASQRPAMRGFHDGTVWALGPLRMGVRYGNTGYPHFLRSAEILDGGI